jgi:hypothetical protein
VLVILAIRAGDARGAKPLMGRAARRDQDHNHFQSAGVGTAKDSGMEVRQSFPPTNPFRNSQDEILRYSRQECLRYAKCLGS